MCGIAGIFAHRADAQPVDVQELLAIREAMARRGPDGAGLWVSGDKRVGLAHRRLSIIDLSDAGAQPMANADSSLQVVFNGEIYNYREIRRELITKGYVFRSDSDTEVLLHLYAEHGAEMVHQLRGMYAFAIWDGRNRRLLLARDPFGIKPLYYAYGGGTFRFASQVKALLAGGGVSTSLEPAGHVGFFLWGYVPEPYTLFKGIRALPAGSSLVVDAAGLHGPVRFFDVTEELRRAHESAASISQLDARDRLRSALRDTVQHHMIADVPVGAFLSAGLDSSTLTALAAQTENGRLHTITLGFREYQGTQADETPLAALVAEQCGTQHSTEWVAKPQFQGELERLLHAMDQPSIDGVNTYFVSKVAAAAGMKVALSGVGGDELFGGYPSFSQVPRIAEHLGLNRLLPGIGRTFRRVSAPWMKYVGSPKYAGLLEYGGTYGGAYLLRRGLYMPWELPDILDADVVREGWRELQPLLRLEETVRDIPKGHLKVSALELTWYMRSQLLRDSDWAGMAHSLEIRVPLVDVELFKTVAPLMAAATPPTKQDMALAAAAHLPQAVLQRPKTGFTIPVHQWLQTGGQSSTDERGLRGWAHAVIAGIHAKDGAVSADVLWPYTRTRRKPVAAARKVLIYRLGSLGDTVVALPCFHLIAKTFPWSERRVLTNIPVSIKVAPLNAILGEGDLVHGYMAYPIGLRGVKPMLQLRKEIKRWNPDTLVYLAEPRGLMKTLRDAMFFKLCGIKTIIGLPYTRSLEKNEWRENLSLFEHEAERLARCLRGLGDAGLEDPASWSLNLTRTEQERALEPLRNWGGKEKFIACSLGTKVPVKDWGQDNWSELLRRLAAKYTDFGLVLVGAANEYKLSEVLSQSWPGPRLNLCGTLTPRESAEALRGARVFIGHDSGPMHLAASVGTPCVAIFTARNLPGVWYPYGHQHKVIYHQTACFGCNLDVCERHRMKCIRSITVDEVAQAMDDVMARQGVARGLAPMHKPGAQEIAA